MIKAMSKVQLIGSKGMLDEVIRLLHNLGIVHIESMPARIAFEDSYMRRMPVEKEKALLKERLERIADRLKGIYLLLPASGVERGDGFVIADIASDAFLHEVDGLEKEVKGLHAEKAELTEEISSIARYEKILKGIAPLVAKLKGLNNFETIGITIELAKEDIIPLFENEINRITETRYQFFVKDIDKDIIGIVITYPRQYDTRVKALISTEAISEIKLPHRYVDMTLFDALKNMIKRREEIPLLIRDIDNKFKELSEEWYKKLEGLMEFLLSTLDEFKVLAYCGHTRFAFVIAGWIPKDEYNTLSNAVREKFGDKVMVREMGVREDEVDLIPVYIKNPKFLRPFEVFINILPPPKYGSIDPTPYLALFFPTFFGLMLGDIGYGSILFVVSIYMKRRFKERDFITNLASVFTISSVFAIVFGALFGEFFGDLGERLGILHPIIFDRLKALKVFLILAIGIGLGHVILGFLLAITNYIHRGKARQAAAKASALILMLAFLIILAVLAKYLPKGLMTPGAAVMTAALVILILLEGIIGPLEVIKALGNILSYARIMAIGTASVVLAIVANKLGGLAGNIILGILIAGIIHTINIFLGVLGPTMHSLRLHYVEFFSKFYETGGRRYEPFRKHK
ncbi:MAG: V-type ATPase 116kDa subunit family protein [Deltaproteobacteria bacterium]|nr:V-type ATPase 116kDa subunit family protein [Deltaproteobacteria bacterium]